MEQDGIGAFLRARRERTRLADVGLVPRGRRLVSGLRRDEVAMLAGISLSHYIRLEQDRSPHVPDEVLDKLTEGLGLDDSERAQLHAIARS